MFKAMLSLLSSVRDVQARYRRSKSRTGTQVSRAHLKKEITYYSRNLLTELAET